MATVKCLFAFRLHLKKGHTCPAHTHDCTELVLNYDCAGTLHQTSGDLRYQARTVCVYQPGGAHHIVNRIAGDQLCLGVSGCGAGEIPPGVYPLTQELAGIAKTLEDALEKENADDWLDVCCGMLALTLREAAARGAADGATAAEKIRAILDSSLEREITLPAVAREVFISPDYMRQIFRAAFGESPLHYLLRRRIENGCKLLTQTDLPVQEIARRCGIENPFYFSRLFRKLMQATPSAYRARHRQTPKRSAR